MVKASDSMTASKLSFKYLVGLKSLAGPAVVKLVVFFSSGDSVCIYIHESSL